MDPLTPLERALWTALVDILSSPSGLQISTPHLEGAIEALRMAERMVVHNGRPVEVDLMATAGGLALQLREALRQLEYWDSVRVQVDRRISKEVPLR